MANPKCRYCGRPLAQRYEMSQAYWNYAGHNKGWTEREYRAWKRLQRTATGKYGYADSGLFCTLSCGFWWAVRQLEGKLSKLSLDRAQDAPKETQDEHS